MCNIAEDGLLADAEKLLLPDTESMEPYKDISLAVSSLKEELTANGGRSLETVENSGSLKPETSKGKVSCINQTCYCSGQDSPSFFFSLLDS